jgi:hypothetical protein
MEQPTQKSEFRIFEGDRLPNFEYPMAIVTFQQEREDLFFTEFFILRPHLRQVASRREIGSGEHAAGYLELKGIDALLAE